MKKLSLLLLLFPFYSFTQSLTLEWMLKIGDDREEGFSSIKVVEDDHFLILGNQFNSEDDEAETNAIITKLNLQGEIIWQNTFGGEENDWLVNVKIDREGNYLFSGSSYSNIDGENQGFSDIWLLKTTVDGELLWQKTIGSSSYDRHAGLEITSDNDIIFATFSNDIDGDFAGFTGTGSAIVIKFSPNGDLIWGKRYLQEDYITGLFQPSDIEGQYYLVGKRPVPESEICDQHGFVLNIDDEGQELSSFFLGGEARNNVNAIYFLGEDDLLLSMSTSSDEWGDSYGNTDIAILRTTRTGEVLSSTTIGTGGQDNEMYLSPTPNSFFIAGSLNSRYFLGTCPNTTISGEKQLFYAQLGYNGEQEFFAAIDNITSAQNQFMVDVVPTPDDSHLLVVKNSFTENDDSGFIIYEVANDGSSITIVAFLPVEYSDLTDDFKRIGECNYLLSFSTSETDGIFASGGGSNNIWVFNYNACLNSVTRIEDLPEVELFPNPVVAGQSIQLRFPTRASQIEDIKWQLYDLAGRLISQEKTNNFNNHDYSITLPAHLSGMHILELKYGEQIQQFKIVIQ